MKTPVIKDPIPVVCKDSKSKNKQVRKVKASTKKWPLKQQQRHQHTESQWNLQQQCDGAKDQLITQ